MPRIGQIGVTLAQMPESRRRKCGNMGRDYFFVHVCGGRELPPQLMIPYGRMRAFPHAAWCPVREFFFNPEMFSG
ncbi:hypothetical protein HMPREF3038_01530 [Akkermansia sp. KLE1797]|nr:hypothetical protein HMPREF3038_01530 [Akkermansia sp. KLE1797]KXU54018.1 hypothetical protein HMPREF3039_01683 [Akkermansia sp. KLE1798]KZA05502.1 hypothetical protein HMPREF1326_00677 [Akkermansia sp. KLE1605]